MESASQSRQADKAKPLVSIKDIAKEAGVSSCTVSLVMNNKDRNRVSKAVAQRVRGTAQSMGYKPNSVARTLRTSRSYVLGFITDEIATSPHAGRVLVGAQEAARKLGYILLTVNTGNDRELENQEIAALRQYRVDGFRFDLASILTRDQNGAPMPDPPILQGIACDPILGHVKLIAEAWDAAGLYQVGSFPAFRRCSTSCSATSSFQAAIALASAKPFSCK